jgi:sialate O-acetylesterase
MIAVTPRHSAALLLALFMYPYSASAAVTVPTIIGDHMVLQAGQPLRLWGWADPGEAVVLTLGVERATTTADARGDWLVTLPARQASRVPTEMTVSGRNTITIHDILIGEVWVGSGQSNMQFGVQASPSFRVDVATSYFPEMRLYLVPLVTAATPAKIINARWVVCEPQTVSWFSATLYFFGREIHRTLGVPVGLVASSWGGSRIEPWIPPVAFESKPELAPELRELSSKLADYGKARLNHVQATKSWLAEAEPLASEGKDFPDAPIPPSHPLDNRDVPTSIYNGMITGLIPFRIRGVVWYQGESNWGQGMHYRDLMGGLIEGWRKVWNQGSFPFLFVQIAPYRYDDEKTTMLPELWEAQTASLAFPNTGMVVTTDIATIDDQHSSNKQEVGRRLALWALAKTYGKDVAYSGPLFDSMTVEGATIRIRFQHSTGGLVSRDGKPLNWFAISGDDRRFVKGTATIDGETVVVSAPEIATPAAVRFGWDQLAQPNLMNRAGLPASPFRTDRW